MYILLDLLFYGTVCRFKDTILGNIYCIKTFFLGGGGLKTVTSSLSFGIYFLWCSSYSINNIFILWVVLITIKLIFFSFCYVFQSLHHKKKKFTKLFVFDFLHSKAHRISFLYWHKCKSAFCGMTFDFHWCHFAVHMTFWLLFIPVLVGKMSKISYSGIVFCLFIDFFTGFTVRDK